MKFELLIGGNYWLAAALFLVLFVMLGSFWLAFSIAYILEGLLMSLWYFYNALFCRRSRGSRVN
jgi:VIT1/CCC1 family predicted Fe2+/Mn2+ transporter